MDLNESKKLQTSHPLIFETKCVGSLLLLLIPSWGKGPSTLMVLLHIFQVGATDSGMILSQRAGGENQVRHAFQEFHQQPIYQILKLSIWQSLWTDQHTKLLYIKSAPVGCRERSGLFILTGSSIYVLSCHFPYGYDLDWILDTFHMQTMFCTTALWPLLPTFWSLKQTNTHTHNRRGKHLVKRLKVWGILDTHKTFVHMNCQATHIHPDPAHGCSESHSSWPMWHALMHLNLIL